MSNSKMILLLLSAALTGALAQETATFQEAVVPQEQKQAGQWKVGLGIGYRHFESTDLKLNRRESRTLYENRNLGAMYESAYSTTVISGKDADVDFSDGLTPVVTCEYEFWRKDALSVSIVANFQYFNLDSSSSVTSETEITKYYTSILHPEFGQVNGGSETSGTRSHASVDMDLLVMDCGLRGNYSICDTLSFIMSSGPSLNYTDFSVKYAGHTHSSEKLTGGIYTEAGLKYRFCEAISVEGVLRYDWTFSKAETSVAEQELNGFGAAIKTIYSF